MSLGLDAREDDVLKGLLRKRAAYMQANHLGIFAPGVRERAIAAIPHETRVEIGKRNAEKLRAEKKGIFDPAVREKAVRALAAKYGLKVS